MFLTQFYFCSIEVDCELQRSSWQTPFQGSKAFGTGNVRHESDGKGLIEQVKVLDQTEFCCLSQLGVLKVMQRLMLGPNCST